MCFSLRKLNINWANTKYKQQNSGKTEKLVKQEKLSRLTSEKLVYYKPGKTNTFGKCDEDKCKAQVASGMKESITADINTTDLKINTKRTILREL